MNCDLCGADKALVRAVVEGVELSVCDACSSLGEVVATVVSKEVGKERGGEAPQSTRPIRRRATASYVEHPDSGESEEVVVSGAGLLVKQARERLGLKQEELARRLAIKESLLHKIENGSFEPSIVLARKLERFLKIRLVETSSDITAFNAAATSSEPLTLGDVLSVKKR
ncbi:TIGR00270 family protein [Candidatus Woesearchaeota archaeon]|nr:MAG: TIGR00270 family protein [Candidatus Woesearchaeota archaeon]